MQVHRTPKIFNFIRSNKSPRHHMSSLTHNNILRQKIIDNCKVSVVLTVSYRQNRNVCLWFLNNYVFATACGYLHDTQIQKKLFYIICPCMSVFLFSQANVQNKWTIYYVYNNGIDNFKFSLNNKIPCVLTTGDLATVIITWQNKLHVKLKICLIF